MCLRIIFGWEKPYQLLLEENSLETLENRRKRLCLNFAQKCTESDIFKSWFPIENNKEHDLRATRKYALPKFNCNRYDKLPLNYMRRLLNEAYASISNQPIVTRYTR